MPNSSEREFELVFGELAFAALQDKAPSIVPKVIGFQVLESSDDQTHAIGVFAADVAEQMVYVPVFFHSGEIKGIEMMYLSEQDIFVPMRDNWIAYLITRRPTDLGDDKPIPREELSRISYSLSRLRRGGGTGAKMAAATDRVGLVRGRPVYGSRGPGVRFLPALALKTATHTRSGTDLSALDLRKALGYMHPSATVVLAKMAGASPAVMEALSAHYGESGVADMLLSAKFRAKMAAANPELNSVDPVVLENQRVSVTDYEQLEPGEFAGLSESEREQLMRGEYVVRDQRDSTSRVYRAAFKITLTTPQRTGVYDVPTDDGMLRCLVALSPISLSGPDNGSAMRHRCADRFPVRRQHRYDGPHQPSFRSFGPDYSREPAAALIVNLDGNGAATGPSECLNVNDTYTAMNQGLGSRGVKPESMQEGKRYVLLDSAGHCTEPFTFKGSVATEHGSTVLSLMPTLYPAKPKGDNARWVDAPVEVDCLPVRGDTAYVAGRLMVPRDSTTAVEVKVEDLGYDESGYPLGDYKLREHGGLPRLLSQEQVEQALRSSGMTPISIRGSGKDYKVVIGRENEKSAQLYGERELLSYLCVGLGVRGELAKTLVKEASAAHDRNATVSGWIDFADGYPRGAVKSGFYVAPPMPTPQTDSELGVPAMYAESVNEAVGGLEADTYDQSGYDLSKYVGRGAPAPGMSPNAMAVADAAATGQKDVFDTAAVATLTKTYDSDELVDRYLSDIILGMDRIGRILFLLLKHFDQFRARYGAQDAVRLEDSLRNAFRLVGDLCMDLKERDVGSHADGEEAMR